MVYLYFTPVESIYSALYTIHCIYAYIQPLLSRYMYFANHSSGDPSPPSLCAVVGHQCTMGLGTSKAATRQKARPPYTMELKKTMRMVLAK